MLQEDEEPLEPDELPEHLRPPVPIDPNLVIITFDCFFFFMYYQTHYIITIIKQILIFIYKYFICQVT